jgi:filamentous hemagglutinin
VQQIKVQIITLLMTSIPTQIRCHCDNSGNTTIKPNGTPEGNGVWENGVVYQPGDKYYGYVVQDIIYYPGGYFITIAA